MFLSPASVGLKDVFVRVQRENEQISFHADFIIFSPIQHTSR